MEGWQQIAGIWEEAETDCPSQALAGASATYSLILDVCLKNCETVASVVEATQSALQNCSSCSKLTQMLPAEERECSFSMAPLYHLVAWAER